MSQDHGWSRHEIAERVAADGSVLVADPHTGTVIAARTDGSRRTLHRWATIDGVPAGGFPVASLGSGATAVLDRSEERLLLLRDGGRVMSAGWHGEQSGALNDPRAIAIDADGRMLVVERGKVTLRASPADHHENIEIVPAVECADRRGDLGDHRGAAVLRIGRTDLVGVGHEADPEEQECQ